MSTVTLTESAIAYFQGILEKQKDVLGVRLGVVDSGCSGLSYTLDLAKEVHSTDRIFKNDNVEVIVDEKSLHYLKGTQVDCVQEGLNKSLKFNNPNVDSTCGCGESFSISNKPIC